jgi:hypothetical protein
MESKAYADGCFWYQKSEAEFYSASLRNLGDML